MHRLSSVSGFLVARLTLTCYELARKRGRSMAGEPVRLDLGGRVFHRLRGKTRVTGAHPFGNPDLCSRRERENYARKHGNSRVAFCFNVRIASGFSFGGFLPLVSLALVILRRDTRIHLRAISCFSLCRVNRVPQRLRSRWMIAVSRSSRTFSIADAVIRYVSVWTVYAYCFIRFYKCSSKPTKRFNEETIVEETQIEADFVRYACASSRLVITMEKLKKKI